MYNCVLSQFLPKLELNDRAFLDHDVVTILLSSTLVFSSPATLPLSSFLHVVVLPREVIIYSNETILNMHHHSITTTITQK
jgi:hypothetical protein